MPDEFPILTPFVASIPGLIFTDPEPVNTEAPTELLNGFVNTVLVLYKLVDPVPFAVKTSLLVAFVVSAVNIELVEFVAVVAVEADVAVWANPDWWA